MTALSCAKEIALELDSTKPSKEETENYTNQKKANIAIIELLEKTMRVAIEKNIKKRHTPNDRSTRPHITTKRNSNFPTNTYIRTFKLEYF